MQRMLMKVRANVQSKHEHRVFFLGKYKMDDWEDELAQWENRGFGNEDHLNWHYPDFPDIDKDSPDWMSQLHWYIRSAIGRHVLAFSDVAPAENRCNGGGEVLEFAPGTKMTPEMKKSKFWPHKMLPHQEICQYLLNTATAPYIDRMCIEYGTGTGKSDTAIAIANMFLLDPEWSVVILTDVKEHKTALTRAMIETKGFIRNKVIQKVWAELNSSGLQVDDQTMHAVLAMTDDIWGVMMKAAEDIIDPKKANGMSHRLYIEHRELLINLLTGKRNTNVSRAVRPQHNADDTTVYTADNPFNFMKGRKVCVIVDEWHQWTTDDHEANGILKQLLREACHPDFDHHEHKPVVCLLTATFESVADSVNLLRGGLQGDEAYVNARAVNDAIDADEDVPATDLRRMQQHYCQYDSRKDSHLFPTLVPHHYFGHMKRYLEATSGNEKHPMITTVPITENHRRLLAEKPLQAHGKLRVVCIPDDFPLLLTFADTLYGVVHEQVHNDLEHDIEMLQLETGPPPDSFRKNPGRKGLSMIDKATRGHQSDILNTLLASNPDFGTNYGILNRNQVKILLGKTKDSLQNETKKLEQAGDEYLRTAGLTEASLAALDDAVHAAWGSTMQQDCGHKGATHKVCIPLYVRGIDGSYDPVPLLVVKENDGVVFITPYPVSEDDNAETFRLLNYIADRVAARNQGRKGKGGKKLEMYPSKAFDTRFEHEQVIMFIYYYLHVSSPVCSDSASSRSCTCGPPVKQLMGDISELLDCKGDTSPADGMNNPWDEFAIMCEGANTHGLGPDEARPERSVHQGSHWDVALPSPAIVRAGRGVKNIGKTLAAPLAGRWKQRDNSTAEAVHSAFAPPEPVDAVTALPEIFEDEEEEDGGMDWQPVDAPPEPVHAVTALPEIFEEEDGGMDWTGGRNASGVYEQPRYISEKAGRAVTSLDLSDPLTKWHKQRRFMALKKAEYAYGPQDAAKLRMVDFNMERINSDGYKGKHLVAYFTNDSPAFGKGCSTLTRKGAALRETIVSFFEDTTEYTHLDVCKYLAGSTKKKTTNMWLDNLMRKLKKLKPTGRSFVSLDTRSDVQLAVFNHPDNYDGRYIKFAIACGPQFTTSIDYNHVSGLHMLNLPLQAEDLMQAMGRITRHCSMKQFPHEKWRAFIYMYVSEDARNPFRRESFEREVLESLVAQHEKQSRLNTQLVEGAINCPQFEARYGIKCAQAR